MKFIIRWYTNKICCWWLGQISQISPSRPISTTLEKKPTSIIYTFDVKIADKEKKLDMFGLDYWYLSKLNTFVV